MSAAVCLLASLLSCPYPDTGARLRPSTEHTQSIKRERLGDPPPPIVARFGPDERFGATDPQIPIPFIFSRVDENQELDHQEPRDKKRKKIDVSSVDKPKQQLKTRTKIIVKTTETKTVETAYTEQTPLKEQWRLSSLFGVRNANTPRYPNRSPECPASTWRNPDTRKSYAPPRCTRCQWILPCGWPNRNHAATVAPNHQPAPWV